MFFFNDTATTEIYTLSLHDALPISSLTDTRSADYYRRALELMPGGVNSPVRAMRAIGRDPIFIARGEGAELIDVDGNRYVDRKSTRLNSSHSQISYAVFCLTKKRLS